MEFEVQTPCFKNASLRREYLAMVTESFDKAEGHAELIILYQEFEPMLEKMRVGGEYDQMVFDIINARYKAHHERIDESREWVHKILGEWNERTGQS